MTTRIEQPSAPPSAARPECPACGTWFCDDCGARRPYASRFAAQLQHCAICHSVHGHLTPARHRARRADDHEASYQSCIADGLVLRYPLEDARDVNQQQNRDDTAG